MKKIIEMPRILPDSYKTFFKLANIQNTIKTCKEERIILDFSNCIFSHAIFTSFIGALFVLAKSYNKKLTYRLNAQSKLFYYIYDSGLYDFIYGNNYTANNTNSIPFTEIKMADEAIIDYTNKILEYAPIKLTEKADSLLFKNIYELFNNALEHSESQNGIYGCGHWFPKKQELAFSVYDTGIGIPTSIKRKINSNFSSKDAIKWSFSMNNSTLQLVDNTPRGVGLPTFLNFITLNKGFLSIVSNDICYIYNNKETFHILPHPIVGTIISFTIKSDTEHIYDVK